MKVVVDIDNPFVSSITNKIIYYIGNIFDSLEIRLSYEDYILVDNRRAIISINKDNESFLLLKKLRKSGISSLMFSEKPTKALEYANSTAIPYVIFLGEDEVSKQKFKLRNMQSGEEKNLSEKQLLIALKNTA